MNYSNKKSKPTIEEDHNVLCPYCKFVLLESEYSADEIWTMLFCRNCNKNFMVFKETEKVYSTYKMEDMAEEDEEK